MAAHRRAPTVYIVPRPRVRHKLRDVSDVLFGAALHRSLPFRCDVTRALHAHLVCTAAGGPPLEFIVVFYVVALQTKIIFMLYLCQKQQN